MSNDSSIIAIESLELESVTGGFLLPPPGGATGQTTMNIPGGGSLTCPAGTVPDHSKTTGTADGTGSFDGGLIKIGLKGGVTVQHDTCVIPAKAK